MAPFNVIAVSLLLTRMSGCILAGIFPLIEINITRCNIVIFLLSDTCVMFEQRRKYQTISLIDKFKRCRRFVES